MLADDEHVVVLVISTPSRGDEAIEAQQVFILHVDDGKTSEVWLTALDPYAIDAFWA